MNKWRLLNGENSTSHDGAKKFLPALCLILGSAALLGSFLIPPESPDYPKRWLTFLVGCMVVVIGFGQIESLRKIPVSDEFAKSLQYLARILAYGTFATVFLAGGLVFSDEISGGIPFLSDAANQRLGGILFSAFGGVLAVIAILQVIGLIRHLVRWFRRRQRQ